MSNNDNTARKGLEGGFLNRNHEVVLYILLMATDRTKAFKRSWTKTHSFFFKISNDEEFSDLFDKMLFDTNGPYPFSEELDEILSEFQLTGIIGSPNPILKEYSINISMETAESIFSPLPTEENVRFEKLAALFSETLGICSSNG